MQNNIILIGGARNAAYVNYKRLILLICVCMGDTGDARNRHIFICHANLERTRGNDWKECGVVKF